MEDLIAAVMISAVDFVSPDIKFSSIKSAERLIALTSPTSLSIVLAAVASTESAPH